MPLKKLLPIQWTVLPPSSEASAAFALKQAQREREARLAEMTASDIQDAQEGAATKLQSVARGRAVRKEMTREEKAAERIQARQRGRLVRQEGARQKQAATKVQARHRGNQARSQKAR